MPKSEDLNFMWPRKSDLWIGLVWRYLPKPVRTFVGLLTKHKGKLQFFLGLGWAVQNYGGAGGQPRTLPSSGGTAFSFKFDFSSNLITIIGGQRRGDFCNSCGSKAKQMWFSVLLKWFSTLGFKRALKALICTGERTGSTEGEKRPPIPGAPQTGEKDFQASVCPSWPQPIRS